MSSDFSHSVCFAPTPNLSRFRLTEPLPRQPEMSAGLLCSGKNITAFDLPLKNVGENVFHTQSRSIITTDISKGRGIKVVNF